MIAGCAPSLRIHVPRGPYYSPSPSTSTLTSRPGSPDTPPEWAPGGSGGSRGRLRAAEGVAGL